MLRYKLFSLLTIITFTSAQQTNVGRRVDSFIGTRGKKSETDVEKEISIIDFNPATKLEDNRDEIRYHLSKRAHLGFQGTKGKKISESPYKRIGFTGTRGKKSDSVSYPRTDDLDDYYIVRNELAKRKFYGMRGKKLPYPFSLVGVRGKKGPLTTAFFGTRGKKDQFPTDKEDDTDEVAAMMYLLTNDREYIRNHINDDSDFEISSVDIDSQNSQDQPLPSNDGSNA